MIITTNPGSNLNSVALAEYQIELTPQQIVVDGEHHDTREGIALATVDEWTATAKEYPYVLGTSAGQFAGFFNAFGKRDKEILSIQTSRKLIPSYDAACSAVRTLGKSNSHLHIEVVDSMMTDVGAGLATILACEAAKAGLPLLKVVNVVERFCQGSKALIVPETLDNLVKGGRASFLKAFFADLLNLKPILGMKDGELKAIGKMRKKADRILVMVDRMAKLVSEDRPIWIAISHGGVAADAGALAHAMRNRFDVRGVYSAEVSSSIYLHVGPGGLAIFVAPIDDLGWDPPQVKLI
ncbi:MAG: DegV family EDD domain-containing protein [Deltaproteobacteria bacterium]|nr:DegV family EDD domain-containing protein [Deltaproteobacteria bacterium]